MACHCNERKDQGAPWAETCIGQLWLFDGLERQELEALAAKAVRLSFKAGQAVFTQGERAQSIFLIKTGRIRISRVMENGAEIILDIRKPGDYLGEYILNDLEEEYHYPVSAWCLDEVRTCGFSRPIFEALVLEHPAVGLKVIKNLAGRLASLNERLEAMGQSNLEEKLFGVLLNVAREHGVRQGNGQYQIEMPLTHEDMGFLIGAHRVSVTRVMKKLKEAGRITQSGRVLTILGGTAARPAAH